MLVTHLVILITAQAVYCEIDNYYGDEFQASIKVSCAGTTMTIRADTKNPNEGVIHTIGHRSEKGCYEVGRGGLKTFLTLDISTPGRCGVQHNAETGDKNVVVAVRADPFVDLLEDRMFSVSCGRSGFQNSKTDISLVKLSLTDGSRPLRAGQEDVSYNLHVELLNPNPSFGLMVRNCLVFNLAGTSVALVDDRGCHNTNFVSSWSYDQGSGVADTTLYSLRRLPQSNRTFYQCDVQLCQGECLLPDCSGGGGSASSQSRDQEQIFVDTITGSTTVFVADPDLGSRGVSGVIDCSLGGDGNPSWLRGLTIAFGVLFGIMLLINVFLCSAMTCSCTRTEVIEKEPSVYDDDLYGDYDNKTYSDPGSDELISQYGGGQLQSEVGTYVSDRQQPRYLQ